MDSEEALLVLRAAIDRLTPIDVAMSRGLSAREIERLHDDLVELEDYLIDLADRAYDLERLRDDLAVAEARLADLEDERSSREIDRLTAEIAEAA